MYIVYKKILPPILSTVCVMSLFLQQVTLTAAQTKALTNPTTEAARSPATRTGLNARQRKSPSDRRRKARRMQRISAEATDPVSLVGAARAREPEYLFGQAHVTVRGNEDPVIRLGLAPHGPTVVEFPANDNFFAVHPGGSFLVTYDQSPSLATDHYLVFRAGREFAAPPEGSRRPLEPLASVSVQMQSGMFVTFLFYPVSHVSRMAHRCVVSYSREEVVAARRAVGLAVNLDGRDPSSAQPPVASQRIPPASGRDISRAPRSGAALSEQVNGQTPEGNSRGEDIRRPVTGVSAEVTLAEGGEADRQAKRRRNPKKDRDVVSEAQKALARAVKAPNIFTRWSPLVRGLSVASLPPVEINDRRRLAVVAVRNTTTRALRLLPGQPELDIQTLDDDSRPVQIQPVEKLHTETSSLAAVIPAGATIYYAVVYETPALGAQQRLRLTVAHMEAADEPASADLTLLQRDARTNR